jgi:O-antigen ligase
MAGAPVAPATSRAERVAVATSILFLFVAPAAASGGTRASCLIVAALALLVSGAWREAWEHRPSTALFAVLCVWFLLAPLSLAWSVDRQYTFEELRAETFYTLLAFLVFYALASDPRRWRMWCVALFAGTLATLAAKELQQGFGLTLWRHSPDGGPGAFSTHLVLVAPLFVALVWEPPWGLRRGAAFIAGALIALVAAAWTTREPWTTPNRIVWLAFAVVLLAAIAATRAARGFEHASRPGLRAVIIAGSVALAIAFAAAIAAKNDRYYRTDPSPTASVDQDLRPRLWSLGVEKLKEAPWVGHGFGREILARTFLPETPRGVEHPPLLHGHNAFLDIALQLGLVGLAAFVAVLAMLVRQYSQLLARPDVSVLGVIGLALLAGFVTKNLTDDFMHRHNAQVFWALNGMLLGFAARRRTA